jgi:Ca2+-binding EF-hand superfamily protein
MHVYREVWATHLRNEMLIERQRQQNSFKMQKAFEMLDIDMDGYICRDDVSYKL